MEDYIHFKIDGRDLKINKENPDDIFIWKTHGSRGKLKKPYWNQIKIQIRKSDGYREITIAPKQYLLHRVNYFAWNQDWDIHDSSPSNQVDHIDNKGDLPKHQNNDINNLRVVTNQENCFNRNCKGYHFNKKAQKWQAYITVNGKRKHLGYFLLEEEARNAYLEAKKIFHIIQ